MASTSNSTHYAPLVSSVPSPSYLGLPAPSQKGPRTQSAAGASGDAGHVDASYRENRGERENVLCGRRGNSHQRAAVISKNGMIKRCRKDSAGNETKFDGAEYQMDEGVLVAHRCERDVPRRVVKRFKRGVQQHVCNNEKMHPRNRHRGVFLDYSKFAEKYQFLKPYVRTARFGQCNINFRDPLALYYLSKAILKEFYDLEFQLPVDEKHRYLIPCVPSRANYLHHVADLLVDVDLEATAYLKGDIPGHTTRHEDGSSGSTVRSTTAEGREFCGLSSCVPVDSSSDSPSRSATNNSGTSCISDFSSLRSNSSRDETAYPLQGERVTVLDIGVGANCIYPLLGLREYGWKFVGSDVSEASLAVAEQNVRMNALEEKISLRLQPNRENYFKNIVKPGEFYCLTMCNPPFHSCRDEVNVCPVRTLDAQDHEIICDGGESQFIANLIEESKTVCAQVLWFTTLVARATTVKEIKKRLWNELRSFSHERQQQGELMESLWMEHASTVEVTGGRDSEGTLAEDVIKSLRRDWTHTQARGDPAASSAGEEVVQREDNQRGKEAEESRNRTKDSDEQTTTSNIPDEAPTQESEECGGQGETTVKEAPASLLSSTNGRRVSKSGDSCRSTFRVHVCEFRVKELLQGKQTRWVICWTFWTSEQRKAVRRSVEQAPIQV